MAHLEPTSDLYPTDNLYSRGSPASFSLSEFTELATTFWSRKRHREFLRLVLTGEHSYDDHDDSENTHQAFIDPLRDVDVQSDDLRIQRDYDSFIGFADKILVDAPITIYTVPHPKFALSSSIHLFCQLEYMDVSMQPVFCFCDSWLMIFH